MATEAGPGMAEAPGSASSSGRAYHLRPAFHHKFRASIAKECIHEVLKEELAGVQYSPDEIGPITKTLSEKLRDALKAWLPDASGMQTQTVTLRMFS